MGKSPVVAAAIIALVMASGASALPSAPALRDGPYTLAPLAFARFCLDYPRECEKTGGPVRVRLTLGGFAELRRVNRAVNASLRPRAARSPLALWRLGARAGDCNDYAVQKRHELIARGWPLQTLSLAAVKTRRGESHLVLTVRTDRGDLVLDNLRPNVVAWRQTGYVWIARQSGPDPLFWVRLDRGAASSRVAN